MHDLSWLFNECSVCAFAGVRVLIHIQFQKGLECVAVDKSSLRCLTLLKNLTTTSHLKEGWLNFFLLS